MGEKLSIQAQKFVRSRAAAGLLLLALTAHAFVAGSTHFHRLPQVGASPARVSLQNGEERGESAPLGGDEKQCLLCRLQRNLVSDLHHAALVLAPPHALTPGPELLQQVAARPGAALRAAGCVKSHEHKQHPHLKLLAFAALRTSGTPGKARGGSLHQNRP